MSYLPNVEPMLPRKNTTTTICRMKRSYYIFYLFSFITDIWLVDICYYILPVQMVLSLCSSSNNISCNPCNMSTNFDTLGRISRIITDNIGWSKNNKKTYGPLYDKQTTNRTNYSKQSFLPMSTNRCGSEIVYHCSR